MTSPDQPTGDPPGRVQFRGSTKSTENLVEPDTSVVVTDEVVAVHPTDDAEPETPIAFTVPLEDIRRLQCDGFVCRAITIGTGTTEYELPTSGLDELAFRRAIVENSGLSNHCLRLNLDRFGICPCGAGTYAGCMLSVVGIALVLSVVGALLGAAFLAGGIGILALSYGARKFGKRRGANVWERETNGTDAPV